MMGVLWVVYLVMRYLVMRYCECIGGAVTVCDNAAMQWCIVVQRVAECGEVKSGA